MAKKPETTDGEHPLAATEVTSTTKLLGTTFRPGIIYQADEAVRTSLKSLGVLKET